MKINKYILYGYVAWWIPRCPYPHSYPFIFVDNYMLVPILWIFTLYIVDKFADAHWR